MRKEKACGTIISREHQGITEILLVKQHNGLTGFPKGHIDPGETEIQTAKREVREETGLSIEIHPDSPRFEFFYIIPAGPIHKTVVLFLAHLSDDQSTTPQPSEISELIWAPVTEVESYLNFPEWRAVWRKAAANFGRQD